MTSPPLSEGPSPEERIAREILRRFDVDLGAISLAGDNVAATLPTMSGIIADALREAKRSAHLEDARAGCIYCRGRWTKLFRTEPVTGTLAWGKAWVHLNVTLDDEAVECSRPEVWDALSLSTPK